MTHKLSEPHSSNLAERLSKKIERDTGIICDPTTFYRTYAGYWMKIQGAFVWIMQVKGMLYEIGSIYPASECVKKKYHLTNYNDEIFPEEEVLNT